MTDVGRVLWNGCHILRNEGVSNDEYVDQLALLLFIRMASEGRGRLPKEMRWPELLASSNGRLLDNYRNALEGLQRSRIAPDGIFDGAKSQFRTPEALRAVMELLDQTDWSRLDRDIQGAAFEYLVERTASEGKQGAGQYFTPRPLVRALMMCIKPGIKPSDRVISDPATGTAGFLTEAHSWMKSQPIAAANSPRFVGNEIVPRVRRMGAMNLLTHGIEDFNITLGDALEPHTNMPKSDVIVTNPPFGSRGGRRPPRDDFWIRTANKQVNFVQHVASMLEANGRAVMVLPDSCFSGSPVDVQLWDRVFRDFDVHTILRLPKGTFAPYTSGTMTNAVFFSGGKATRATWVYDLRSDMRTPTGKSPLRFDELEEFVRCFGDDPDGQAPRNREDSAKGRWASYTEAELRAVGFRLGGLQQNAEIAQTRLRPLDLVGDVERDLLTALDAIRSLRREMINE